MSCEPAVPNTHTCSIKVIGAHVPDGLKAGAVTALFVINRETRGVGRINKCLRLGVSIKPQVAL